jgi:hypothetical protein
VPSGGPFTNCCLVERVALTLMSIIIPSWVLEITACWLYSMKISNYEHYWKGFCRGILLTFLLRNRLSLITLYTGNQVQSGNHHYSTWTSGT